VRSLARDQQSREHGDRDEHGQGDGLGPDGAVDLSSTTEVT